MDGKLENLKGILGKMESALICYSGGADSTLLLKVANDTLKKGILAVTASSPTYPPSELKKASEVARSLGIEHRIIETRELENPNFVSNSVRRCYWCKRELFFKLVPLAEERSLRYILDGSNYDDAEDFRPGREAAQEFGVRSPLKEAGMGKEDIRRTSREIGLPTWNKPSFACLASRFPYGMRITKEDLTRVNQAEEFLQSLGMVQVRVRHHSQIARIEVSGENISRMSEEGIRDRVVSKLKDLGYSYVTVDLEGYRSGSLNEPLTNRRQKHPFR